MGYLKETAANIMGVLVLISTGGQTVGSGVQVRKCQAFRVQEIHIPGIQLHVYIYNVPTIDGYCEMYPGLKVNGYCEIYLGK